MSDNLIIRQLGLRPYEQVLLAMHRFTNRRTPASTDEIWLVQHPQVFTHGQACKTKHIPIFSNIPVIQSDRGGQVTYHGPGQQVMYVMLNLRYRNLGIRDLVTILEQTVVSTLASFTINAHVRAEAPGVYVGDDKICSLGLRVRKGYSFHGLALNIDMDLTPFLSINPCGYIGLRMTQVSDLVSGTVLEDVTQVLIIKCLSLLGVSISIGQKILPWNPDDY